MCALMVWVTGPISADRTTAEYNALLDRIQETEQLPVIVTLDLKTPFQPEGRLSTTAVQAQRTAIATAQAELSQQLLPYGARIYVEYEVFPLLAVVVDEAAPRFLTTSPLVTSIEEDVAVPVALLSSTAVIGAPATWSQGYDGSGWTVVVLDNGIDSNHPFLTGRMPAEYCFSNANGASFSLCPNGTPYDTSADFEIPACSVSAPGDLCSHGTHVAGIVGGADNGGVPGYNGVAPDAQVIPIQVFTRFNSGCSPTSPCSLSYSSDQLLALQYIFTTLRLSHNISSVNMSLGGGDGRVSISRHNAATANSAAVVVGFDDGAAEALIAYGRWRFCFWRAFFECPSSVCQQLLAVLVGGNVDPPLRHQDGLYLQSEVGSMRIVRRIWRYSDTQSRSQRSSASRWPSVRHPHTEALPMQAIMEAEISLGCHPRDVSKEKPGYDIESLDPRNGRLRFIEVKGRQAGAETVSVTKNEILTARNRLEQFILALVEVSDGRAYPPRYVRQLFATEPDFGVTSVNYDLPDLLARSAPPA